MKTAITIYAVGLLASLLSFIVMLRVDPFGLANLSQNPELPAFFFSIVLLMISDRVSAIVQFKENRELSEDIAEMVKSSHSVIAFRTPRDAIQYVNNRISSLLAVESTSLNMDEEFSTTEDYLYRSAEYEKFLDLIPKQVKEGLIWRDIGDQFAAKKFARLKTEIYPSKVKGSFQARILSETVPQITFLILGYRDGTKEVLFNWDYRAPGSEPTVLLSRDAAVVQMFATHFANLWRISS